MPQLILAVDQGTTGTTCLVVEPDGTVRVEVEGDRSAELLEWLRHGPPFAQVENLEMREIAETGEQGFRVG